MSTYTPTPIDTTGVELPAEVNELTEKLAESVHDNWSQGRINEGWQYGPVRDNDAKINPLLVPYDQLSEDEKFYDRQTAMETLKAIYSLGYAIVPAGPQGAQA